MQDIDRLSRVIPQLCKVAPNTEKYHVEDVHRAGGIFAILGELERAGKLHTDVPTVHAKTLGEALAQWDVVRTQDEAVHTFFKAGPGGIPTQVAFSQSARWPSLDLDRALGCIRSYEHAFSKEGGLAILVGNIALNGCVVKTAGVDDSILVFEGPAHVVESQDEAVANILSDKVKAGDVVIVRYEGPKGGPGMQEMLYPTSYIKSKGLGKACALLTDGRFSGGTSGLSIGHCSPEAAAGGTIGLVQNGDRIRIDIPNRSINVLVSDEELARRRTAQDAKGWKPAQPRPRKVCGGAESLRQAGHQRRHRRGARSFLAGLNGFNAGACATEKAEGLALAFLFFGFVNARHNAGLEGGGWCLQVGQARQQIGQRKLVQMRQEHLEGPIQNTGQAAIAGQQTAVGVGQKALHQGQAGLHAAHHGTNANVFWGMGQANAPTFAAHGG